MAMCTYNGAAYLLEQLHSIEQQTLLPDELIICDDCSCDQTIAIIESFKKKSKLNITLHRNSHNLGHKANFNQALLMLSGDILFIADQDDIWHPTRIEQCVAQFQANPELALVVCNADLVNQRAEPFGQTLWDLNGITQADQQQLAACNVEWVLDRGNLVFYGFLLAFRGALKPSILPIPDDIAHDRWVGTIASTLGPVAVLPQPVANYRLHEQQASGSGYRKAGLGQTLRDRWRYVQLLRNPYFYRGTLNTEAQIRDRLLQIGSDRVNPQAMQYLNQKIAYLHARVEMRQRSWLARPGLVWQEWRSGRYQQFARSWKTILVDVLL
jgi:glycosyltransferase involved in cell wall biosynthesis